MRSVDPVLMRQRLTMPVLAASGDWPAGAPGGADPIVSPETVTLDAPPTWQINGIVCSQAVAGNPVYVTGSFTWARPPGVSVRGAGEPTTSRCHRPRRSTQSRMPPAPRSRWIANRRLRRSVQFPARFGHQRSHSAVA
jgi:hypothetical protein